MLDSHVLLTVATKMWAPTILSYKHGTTLRIFTMKCAAQYTLLFTVLIGLILSADPASAEERYQILFNGKDFSGWEGQEGFWSIAGGSIVGQTTPENPTKGNTFLVWDGEVKDFDFRCKVKFSGNNSGVQYRSKIVDADKHVMAGYQADLHPKQSNFGMLYGEKLKGRGIIAQRGQKVVITPSGKKEIIR